jgi:hypothetical protein
MNMLFGRIRERIGAAIGVAFAAACFLVMGIILAFVVSPQQALEWRRVQNLPLATASTVASAPAGTEIVISGTLADNPVALEGTEYVAYRIDEWQVSETTDDDGNTQRDGDWVTVDRSFPALTLSVEGGTARTTPADQVKLGGSLHEDLQRSSSSLEASDGGESVPDGSTRTQGLHNGDLVTVLGSKASTGDLIPDRLFGGDRVQLVESIRSGARAAFAIGIGMMICSPVVLVGGMLAALFGRQGKRKVL